MIKYNITVHFKNQQYLLPFTIQQNHLTATKQLILLRILNTVLRIYR